MTHQLKIMTHSTAHRSQYDGKYDKNIPGLVDQTHPDPVEPRQGKNMTLLFDLDGWRSLFTGY